MPGRALSRWWLLVVPLSLAAGALGLAPGAAWAQAGPLLLPDAKLEKLFEGRVLTEGVAVAPDGQVYFSEITFSHVARDEQGAIEAGHIWRFDPTTGKTVIYRSPSGMSNGIKFDARGRMVVAEGADFGGRRVTRTDLATGKTHIIAGLYQGRPLNSPNDIAIDERGRVYFSDPRYLGHEPIDQGVQAVYRLDTDGTLHRVVTDAGKPNGVAISPDQKTLYVVSNENGTTAIERLDKGTAPRAGLVASMATPQKQTGGPLFEWPAGSTVEVNKFGSRERRPVGGSRLGHQRDGGFFPGFDLNLGLTLPPADEVSPGLDCGECEWLGGVVFAVHGEVEGVELVGESQLERDHTRQLCAK